MNDNRVTVRVWGDYACFTRPEMKVERVSYPVITPSAARGVLEAIFWEPQVVYLIDAIRIIRKGRWFSFRRNEVISTIGGAQTWMKDPSKVSYIEAGGGAKDGTQRNMLALQDVEYLITAEVRLSKLGEGAPHGLPKYLNEIERRARGGKCFHRPCLGVREFAADFDWVEDAQATLEKRNPDWRSFNDEPGLMLYDVFDANARAEGFKWLNDAEIEAIKATAGKGAKSLPRSNREPIRPKAAFFHATIENATMQCHPDRIRLAG
jgi:CRISPR-associated protein Cas5d